MGDVVRRNATSSIGIVIVLDGGTSTGSILGVEITAADICGLAPRIRNESVETVRKAPLQLRFQCMVMGVSGAGGVIDIRSHPRHRPQRIDGCVRRAIRRGLARGIAESGVRKSSVLTACVGDG